MKRFYPVLFVLFLLSACADLPKFDTSKVDRTILPTQVIASPSAHTGKQIIWGGVILSGKNLKESTQLEVLAYPLDDDGWPLRDKKPLGRFIVSQQGYLETADYAKNRVLTVVGTIMGTEKGKVGEASYRFPVILAQQIHLWEQFEQKTSTGFHFGIGVMYH